MSAKVMEKKNGSTSRSSGMQLARQWSPRTLDSLFEGFRRSVDEFFAPLISATPWLGFESSFAHRYPLVDVEDSGANYVITAELPGFSKDLVEVRANAYSVEISAQSKMKSDDSTKDYVYRERGYVSFNRTLSLPEEILPEKIEASMEHGLLRLTVPKKEPAPEAKMIRVTVK